MSTDIDSVYVRMERVVRRYEHAHGRRVFMADVLLEMIATELELSRCEWPDCGHAGVRVIMVEGYSGTNASEVVCERHTGPMRARKRAAYAAHGLSIPVMYYVSR